jgi:predicted metal-dependent hydrolase
MRTSGKRPTRRTTALRVAGLPTPIEIRRHAAARRMTLRVNHARHAVVVTVPIRCGIEEANSFVHRNIEWVRERLGRIPEPVLFEPDAIVPLRGTPHLVRFVGAEARGREPGVVRIGRAEGRATLDVRGDAEHAGRRLRDFLMAEARRDLDGCVDIHATRLKLRVKRICVRDQVSRWGSCSSSGVLSFSWRLVLAPPFVLDYVAAHEVAHLAEMNHGPRFWALVARSMPRMNEAKQWLRVHGSDLHRYGGKVGPGAA